MKPVAAIMLTAFVCGGAIGAFAADRTISQKGKMFSEAEVTVKVGDTLIFVNDDTIHHNVLSATTGQAFNLGSQAPGASNPVTFKTAGEVKIICAIHPQMKMTVKVE